jgi:hypothetical protein
VRKAKAGGIDWWRYGKEILLKKLIPFAKQCKKERPTTIVQEDKAPSHAHQSQQDIFNINEIQRLLWPGNSPDLNMIEPCWPYMKRRTTVRGSTTFRKVMEKRWSNTWKEMPQAKIQAWIERIPRHIQEIIAVDGDNTYKEGRTGKDTRDWKAEGIRRLKGGLSQRVDFGTQGGILEIPDNDGDEVEAEEIGQEVEAGDDEIERRAVNKCQPKRQKSVRRRHRLQQKQWRKRLRLNLRQRGRRLKHRLENSLWRRGLTLLRGIFVNCQPQGCGGIPLRRRRLWRRLWRLQGLQLYLLLF